MKRFKAMAGVVLALVMAAGSASAGDIVLGSEHGSNTGVSVNLNVRVLPNGCGNGVTIYQEGNSHMVRVFPPACDDDGRCDPVGCIHVHRTDIVCAVSGPPCDYWIPRRDWCDCRYVDVLNPGCPHGIRDPFEFNCPG